MAAEPGNLSDFGAAAQQHWDDLVAGYLGGHGSPHLVAAADDRLTDVVAVDWGAYPTRTTQCLGSMASSLRLLDWSTGQGDIGRALLQEEYVEWRVVRDETRTIRRVEFTTEFPEYWSVLAAHHPATALELIRRFSGDLDVQPAAVYGGVNPFAPGVTSAQRQAGFEDAMLPRGGRAPWSPYNNGQRALCFMSQGANTLGALIALVAAAAFPHVGEGSGQVLSGPEAIASGTQAAQACRNSDPTVVGAVIQLAAAGRLFALDDPIGVYLRGVQTDRLRQPDGAPAPAAWFQFQRGSRPHGSSSLERSQRLVVEVPAGLGFALGDLVDDATGERVEFGGQIADLVQLAAYVRVSPPGATAVEPRPVPLPDVTPCERDAACERDVLAPFRQFEATSRNLLGDTTPGFADRTGAVTR